MITGYAIATLVIFILSIFFVIHPVSIPTPRPFPRLPLNLTTAPILAIALLWAAQCLNPTVIRDGIVGTEGVKPYNILILFFSLAYMAITLDITGILRAAAFWVSNKGGYNGWKLYLYFYVMLTLVSILLGNDPVILSGTAFLVYYTQVAHLNPMAWIMAEFAAANTASMVLFVGNPTNVVICEGFSVNNAAFTAYTILPFLACNVFCFVALAFQYRKLVPRKLTCTTHRDPRSALLDPVGAWVGSFMLGSTLVLCLVVSFFGIDVWMISLPFALAKFLFDLTWDYYRSSRGIPTGLPEAVEEESDEPPVADAKHQHMENGLPISNVNTLRPLSSQDTTDRHPKTMEEGEPLTEANMEDSPSRRSTSSDLERSQSLPSQETATGLLAAVKEGFHEATDAEQEHTKDNTAVERSQTLAPSTGVESCPETVKTKPSVKDQLMKYFPTFMTALPRLPFALVPFAFSQFILIEALNHQGWVNIFANWLIRASGKQVHPTIWLIGVLGVVMCNLSGTNIGATILLTQVVRAAALPYDANRAAAIALAVASNIGAVSFTFSASLAGLLWRSILGQKGVHVRQRDFAFWNLLPIFVMTAVGLGIVSAEMAVLFQSGS